MSSYLTFYGIPKIDNGEKENNNDINTSPIAIVGFSRSSDVYRYFYENCNIASSYDEEKYSEITQSDINNVESDILDSIRFSEKRLNEYEKYANGNPEYISEILNIKEYLESLYKVLHYVEFIEYIVTDAELNYGSGFTKIMANIS